MVTTLVRVNGKDYSIGDDVENVATLKVRIANIFQRFSADVILFTVRNTELVDEDDDAPCPDVVLAYFINERYTVIMWKRAITQHAIAGDFKGANRIVEVMEGLEPQLDSAKLIHDLLMIHLSNAEHRGVRENFVGFLSATLYNRGCSMNAYLAKAAEIGLRNVMRMMLKAGAKINNTDVCGWSPLYWATSYARYDAVAELLQCGGDVRVASQHGWTCLHNAAWQGDEAMCRILQRGRADLTVQAEDGRTPIHLAQAGGYHDLVALLIASHGTAR
eukprot:GEMP01063173.1.p1 GENE.GEMP01063173.1~~GEMP01063173.1.p1  ORF type:complete len:285 (+),score=67.01 GEMP01063173.1:33-857(+)